MVSACDLKVCSFCRPAWLGRKDVREQPAVTMARKGTKVECGHCSFVAKTAAAMEEHMKKHDTDTSDAYPGDSSYVADDTLCSSEQTLQKCLATECQNFSSGDPSCEEHAEDLLRGENDPTQALKDGVLYDTSKTTFGDMQDRLEAAQSSITCEHTSDDNQLEERYQSNHGCRLKITAVRSIAEENEIMFIRSIAEGAEFPCKKELLDNQELKPHVEPIQYCGSTDKQRRQFLENVDARSGSGCEKASTITVKLEPMSCHDSTQSWGTYQPVSSSHMKTSGDLLRGVLRTTGEENAREDRDVSDLSFPKSCHPSTTFSNVSLAAKNSRSVLRSAGTWKDKNIDVVGFGDSATDSGTDSADYCDRSLAEVVPMTTPSIKRHDCSVDESAPSDDGEISYDLKNKDNAPSLRTVAPNLFAALMQPVSVSDSGHDDVKPFVHQDHTYACNGLPGSLTCARVRPYDKAALSARKKKQLRRRVPTMTTDPLEAPTPSELSTTVSKRKPTKNTAILEALSPTKNSEVGTPESGVTIVSPSRFCSPRRRPTTRSAGNAMASRGDSPLHVCTVCQNLNEPASFYSRSSFCSHVINCHREDGGRLYYCAYCRYVAMDMGLVKSHMDEKHGDHATRVVAAAGLEIDTKVVEVHKKDQTKIVRMSNRVLLRKENAHLNGRFYPGAFVEAVVTRKRRKGLRKSRTGDDSSVVSDDELGSMGTTATGFTRTAVSVSHRRNRKARKSQARGKSHTRSLSVTQSVCNEKSPAMTHTSYLESPDCWQEYPDDDKLDDCAPELVDDTCCDMFENSFLSLEWDEREAFGSTLSDIPDPFETGAVIKQASLTGTVDDSNNCEQGSRRYSRRMRKPKRPFCMCGSCDADETISPTAKSRSTLATVDRAKKLAVVASVGSGGLQMSTPGDKTVVLSWREDPKLKMTPIVRLCDIVMAILAGGGGHT